MKPATYKSSGVDIDEANKFVVGLKKLAKNTMSKDVVVRKNSFGALYSLSSGYKNPVLVSSTDGVGTKLLIAKLANKHDTVGIDLVAMNVNDILCAGARPLFFLDYIACGRLNRGILNDVMKGIVQGCRQAGCSLIGGETAEMPDLYKADDYDLAGFSVGVVEKEKMIDGSEICEGDWVMGLASSGIHSNGYSLVRKIFSPAEQKRYAKALLKPTRIYVQPVLKVLEHCPVKGIAHITGGAFYEKLTKILPGGCCAVIDPMAWPVPKIFQTIQKKGTISDSEMFRTFNMGIGMAMVVEKKDIQRIQAFLMQEAVASFVIGQVIKEKSTKIIIRN